MKTAWPQNRLDRVATVNARIGWKALTSSEYQENGYAFLATPNIKSEKIDFESVNYISQFRYDESPELKLQQGDVLLAKDGSTLGIANVVRELPRPATVNGSIAVLRTFAIEPRFLMYALRSNPLQEWIAQVKDGMGVPHLFQADIKKFAVPSPPPDDQQRIADFLDDQIARIDNIIAARRVQSDLLVEEMQSRIDQTTADGDVRRLAPLLELFRDGTHTPPQRVDSGVPLLTAKNVKHQRLAFTETDTAISQADAELLDRSFAPRPGDVLLSVKGSVGNVALVPVGFPRFQVERNLAVLRPARHVLTPEWLYWCLRSRRVQDQIRLAMGFSAQPGVYLGDLASLLIAAPSTQRQASGAGSLDLTGDATASATTTLEASIVLLSALKRSLITAAVTGEFEVSSADGSRVPA